MGRMFILLENFQKLGFYATLLGIYGGNWIVLHRGLKVEVLDSVGEESFIFTESLQFKVLLAPLGIGGLET